MVNLRLEIRHVVAKKTVSAMFFSRVSLSELYVELYNMHMLLRVDFIHFVVGCIATLVICLGYPPSCTFGVCLNVDVCVCVRACAIIKRV